MTKALSLFLALVMVIGMIPVMATVASAEAEDIIADPTTSKTVEINSAADFIALLGTTAENTTCFRGNLSLKLNIGNTIVL